MKKLSILRHFHNNKSYLPETVIFKAMTFFTSWVRKYDGVGVICSKKVTKSPMCSWLIENRNTLLSIFTIF
jgi:hypothetical protein